MVVTQVVRIRNSTLRTFRIQAGDPFYTPRIDDCPCPGGVVDVPPGFDEGIDGLVVPWESLTRGGLAITESGSDDLLRCVVGPIEPFTDNRDYLQYRSSTWEPLAHDRWTKLGNRHVMGAIGNSAEVQLSFRDARGSHSAADGPATLGEVTHFEFASRCVSPNTVFLNIFDLASALSIPNAVLNNTVVTTFGAFHAAVEVYGEEWSFYRTPNATSCGVCKSLHPRHHPVHVYRQSLNLGATKLKDWEVKYLVRGKLASKWSGGDYDLLYRNCIHFCEELQLSLGVKPVPSWVKNLHETGASVFHLPWPLSAFFYGQQKPEPPQCLEDEDDDDQSQSETCSNAAAASEARSPSGHARSPRPSGARLDSGSTSPRRRFSIVRTPRSPSFGIHVTPPDDGKAGEESPGKSSSPRKTPRSPTKTSSVASKFGI